MVGGASHEHQFYPFHKPGVESSRLAEELYHPGNILRLGEASEIDEIPSRGQTVPFQRFRLGIPADIKEGRPRTRRHDGMGEFISIIFFEYIRFPQGVRDLEIGPPEGSQFKVFPYTEVVLSVEPYAWIIRVQTEREQLVYSE